VEHAEALERPKQEQHDGDESRDFAKRRDKPALTSEEPPTKAEDAEDEQDLQKKRH